MRKKLSLSHLLSAIQKYSFVCAAAGMLLLFALALYLRAQRQPDPPHVMAAASPAASVPLPSPIHTPAPTPPPLHLPVSGTLLRGYAQDTLNWSATLQQYTTHRGVDIAAPQGSAVYAVMDGVISGAYADDRLGYVIEIRHAQSVSRYANLMGIQMAQVGQPVQAGEVISSIGRSAMEESGEKDHLHFEWLENGQTKDPAPLLFD